MKNNTLSSRFDILLDIFKNNWKKYLILNFFVLLITYVLFYLTYFFISNIKFNNYYVFAISIFFIFVIIFFYWFLNSMVFISNFYLTKDIYEENKQKSIAEYLKISFKKLWEKALIDFWDFIIFLPFYIVVFVIFIYFTDNSPIGNKFEFIIKVFLFILLFIIVYAFLRIFFVFANYHCFDKEKYSFKHYFSSVKLVKGDYFNILGNVIVISFILIIGNIFISQIMPADFDLMKGLINWLFLFVENFLSLIFGTIWNIYFFIYYKYLDSNEVSVENGVDKNKIDEILEK